MKAKAFRLSEAHIATLKKAAQDRGCTETELIRQFIDGLSRNDKSETPDDTPIYTLLADQLKVKDEQIASLSRALEAAQETANAAQALQAQSSGAVLAKVNYLNRWQRLRKAWRG